MELICQYFLPFQGNQPIDAISTESIIAAFDADAADPGVALDFGPLYSGEAEKWRDQATIAAPGHDLRSDFAGQAQPSLS